MRAISSTDLLFGFMSFFILLFSNVIIVLFPIFHWFRARSMDERFMLILPLNRGGFFFFLFHELCFIMTFISLIKCCIADPGYCSYLNPTPEILSLYNKQCKSCLMWKPPRAHHCSECNKCILRMDHHCPWVSNCVGINNQKYFTLFLMYSGFYAASALLLSVLALIYSGARANDLFSTWFVTIMFFMCIGTFLGGLVHVFLAISVFTDHLYSIFDNQSLVETQKELFGRPDSVWKNCKIAFGEEFFLFWFIPTTPVLNINYMQELYSPQVINHPQSGNL